MEYCLLPVKAPPPFSVVLNQHLAAIRHLFDVLVNRHAVILNPVRGERHSVEGGEHRGYDAGKKITGRKRHIAVDTLGLIWAVVVHAADWQDQEGGHLVLHALRRLGRLRVVFGDSAYGRERLPEWTRRTFGWILQTVLRPVAARGFVVLPKRWIVERTFAWLARYRRHSRDYEHNTETSEAMIQISMIANMSRRLARINGV